MGGNIAWTHRYANGTELRMQRWTNVMPGIFSSDKFYDQDSKFMEESMKSYFEMKADWEKNKDTGKFKENMTEVYAPYPYGLMPSEYGFIASDAISKTVISCNYYTSIGQRKVNPDFITLAKGGVFDPKAPLSGLHSYYKDEDGVFYDDFNISPSLDFPGIQKAYDEGRITKYMTGDWAEKLPEGKSLAEILTEACETTGSRGKYFGIGYLTIEPPNGWKIFDYYPGNERQQAFDKVQKIFILTDKEKEEFNNWIKMNEED